MTIESELKRYVFEISRASNLSPELAERWLLNNHMYRVAYLPRGSGSHFTLHDIWLGCWAATELLRIALAANVDQHKIVLAACACARVSLPSATQGDDRPRLAIETAERWVGHRVYELEIDEAMGNARDAADQARSLAAASAAYAAMYAVASAHAVKLAFDVPLLAVNAVPVASNYLADAVRSVISPFDLRPRL